MSARVGEDGFTEAAFPLYFNIPLLPDIVCTPVNVFEPVVARLAIICDWLIWYVEPLY